MAENVSLVSFGAVSGKLLIKSKRFPCFASKLIITQSLAVCQNVKNALDVKNPKEQKLHKTVKDDNF